MREIDNRLKGTQAARFLRGAGAPVCTLYGLTEKESEIVEQAKLMNAGNREF